jgi:hypothetical protein
MTRSCAGTPVQHFTDTLADRMQSGTTAGAVLPREELAHEAGVNDLHEQIGERGSFVGLGLKVKLAKVLQVEPADLLGAPARKSRSRGSLCRE